MFGADWSIAHVATLLRSNAGRGAWRPNGPGGANTKVNQHYLRTLSALHLPTRVSVVFMRLDDGGSLYASLSFVSDGGYLPWNAEVAELWLEALFGAARPNLVEIPGHPRVHSFMLAAGAPAVTRTVLPLQ